MRSLIRPAMTTLHIAWGTQTWRSNTSPKDGTPLTALGNDITMTRTKVKKEYVKSLVQSGTLKLGNDNGGTLELVMRKQEPAVLVDGKYIIRRTQLVRAIADGTTPPIEERH